MNVFCFFTTAGNKQKTFFIRVLHYSLYAFANLLFTRSCLNMSATRVWNLRIQTRREETAQAMYVRHRSSGESFQMVLVCVWGCKATDPRLTDSGVKIYNIPKTFKIENRLKKSNIVRQTYSLWQPHWRSLMIQSKKAKDFYNTHHITSGYSKRTPNNDEGP